MKTLDFGDSVEIAVQSGNASAEYARTWLEALGLPVADTVTPDTLVLIRAGQADEQLDTPCEVATVRVWDFQVGKAGTGVQASAVSGVSWVLGEVDEAPLSLPGEMPEKWCGLFGATLAMSVLLERETTGKATPRVMDVSAADVLRAFADQNAGNHAEIVRGWRRNGRVAVEHGGIYPQGFFECADGFVAVVGRSRKDWVAIREAVGWPEAYLTPEFDDPFLIAQDPLVADRILVDALASIPRDELLRRALNTGATIAPVYSLDEVLRTRVLRPEFDREPGVLSLPFVLR